MQKIKICCSNPPSAPPPTGSPLVASFITAGAINTELPNLARDGVTADSEPHCGVALAAVHVFQRDPDQRRFELTAERIHGRLHGWFRSCDRLLGGTLAISAAAAVPEIGVAGPALAFDHAAMSLHEGLRQRQAEAVADDMQMRVEGKRATTAKPLGFSRTTLWHKLQQARS